MLVMVSHAQRCLLQYHWDSLADGSWGSMESCADDGRGNPGGFGTQLRVQFEGSQGGGDDTAMNSLYLSCSNGGSIDSKRGFWGGWRTVGTCSQGFNAIQLRVESDQGLGDDSATNGIRLYCVGGGYIGYNGIWGSWGDIKSCPGNSKICGIQTQVESEQGIGD